ncbi:unnamed protein product [Rotaria socialis]|uniref:Uncharacterized protein n=1 Tax=Rotaria socialis TaxID=392032 RepID=A0A821UFL5_9BILA|nr:unnamed protein product [Rotaria socialis]CAF4889318.1 unnamed protein product [Rotaria socialis]
MIANNEVLHVNPENGKVSTRIELDFEATDFSQSPCFRFLAVAGDGAVLMNTISGRPIAKMERCHAVAYLDDGLIATGGDKILIYDVRKMSPLYTFEALNPIRSISLTKKHTVFASSHNCVTVFDSTFSQRQDISVFGQIAGVAVGDRMHVFIDDKYACVAEYEWDT